MSLPVVAIVGRPNVGKSSLFNWLAGRRIAIVDPTAGVTRDRVSTIIPIGKRYVELIDTGGMGIEDVDNLTADVERQIDAAIETASVILFVVDGRDGLVPLDEEVGKRLRYVDRPVILVANKCDTEAVDVNTSEFYRMGRGKLLCVSAKQNRGRDDLFRLIGQRLPEPKADEEAVPQEPSLKIAIVGRRNTGKSTFINCLAESERMIVSEVAGTTRDSVDVRFERDGKTFVAIDTAGVRKKKSLASDIEFYSISRAERSIRRADVVLLFFDAPEKISKVDKQLADYILDQSKPAIFVVNKWDLMVPMPTEKMAKYIKATFPSLDHVPIAFITAKAGRNVYPVLNLAQSLFKQSSARVSTGDLNRVVREAILKNPPPLRQNRRAKLYYATQVGVNPPTIVLFTNAPELFDPVYERYLINVFRDQLPFSEVSIKLHLRRRKREDVEIMDEMEPKEPRKKKRVDVSGLKFRTKLEDGEEPGRGGAYESELWRDV